MKKYVSLGIMITLYSGKRVTAPELAEKYETSVKTIYRAMEILLEAGMPIRCISGKGGGYEIIKESKINTSFFTMSELGSFISFIKSNKSFSNSPPSSIEERLEMLPDGKMKEDLFLETASFVFDTENWGSTNENNLLVEHIKDAILNSKKIEIEYESKTSIIENRVLHPYTVVFKSGIWYLYAFCEKRKAFRLFKLSRIKSLKQTDILFERQNIDTLSKPWNKEFKSNFENIKIKLLATEKILPEIIEWIGKNSIKINPQNNEKKYGQNLQNTLLEFEANFSKGLIHRLMQFSDEIQILSPQKLKDEIANECYKIYKNYAN